MLPTSLSSAIVGAFATINIALMSQIAIVAGTVYGTAQFVAEELAQSLSEAGHDALFLENASVEALCEADYDSLVVCCSTTGSGEIPDNLQPFYSELKDSPDLSALQFAVVALGDSSYLDTFCGGGNAVHAALEDCGATPLAAPLELDACEVDTPEDLALPWVEELLNP